MIFEWVPLKVCLMSLWILAILLLAALAGLGFAKGAVRSVISLVGLILGVALAIPFGSALQPLLGKAGLKNPVWLEVVPPLVAFLIVYLAFLGGSFFVHHKLYLLYKYKRSDVDRIRWERTNRQVGAAVGLLAGTILFLAISGVIYAAGYLTVQLSGETNPASVQFINSVRQDMAASGFDKVAAKFQPAPKLYFETADLLGLLYHNPLLQSRLATYPYFLALGERPEFKEIGTDKEYNDLIFGKAAVTQIIDHARTQSLLSNHEVLQYLKGTDPSDLKEYLRTGQSPKYSDTEILGIWNLDKASVLTVKRRENPDIKARELRALRQALDAVPDFALVATPENKVIVRSGAAAPAAADAPAAEEAPVDPAIARYGPEYARRMRQPTAPAAPVAAPPPPAPKALPEFTGEGTWSDSAGLYSVSLPSAAGPLQGTARIRADEMMLSIGGTTLVFSKQ